MAGGHKQPIEERVQGSEGFFRALAENSLDLILVADVDGIARYVNPSVERVLGYTPEEFVGMNVPDLLHPEDHEQVMKVFAEAAENPPGTASRFAQGRYRRKDGSWSWIEGIAINLLDDPETKGILCCGRDISERKHLENELRFSRLLIDNAMDIIGLVGADTTIRYISPSVEAVVGYTPEELVGTNTFDYIHPDDIERLKVVLAEALSSPGPSPSAEYRHRRKDGSWLWIEATGNNLLGDPMVGGILFVARDITGRKRLEEELRQYQLLVENTLDMLAIINPDNTWRYVSPAFERVLGYEPEELVGALSSDLLHPDDLVQVMSSGDFDEIAEARGPTPPIEYRYRHKDGSYRYLAVILNNLMDDPSINGVIGSGRDVTERRRAEEEIRRLNETLEERVKERTAQLEALVSRLETQGRMLRESEEQFRTTFDQAAVGIAHVAPDGRWLRVNQKLCEIVGYTREELLERSFQDITHSDDIGKDLDHLRRMLDGEIDTYSVEKRYVKKDYSQIWVSLTVSLVRDPSGDPNYFISVIEDITERKRAELLLRSLTPREAEVLRLLALGRTNREIAREMMFSVSTVKNHVQHIITKLDASDRTQAAVRAVELGLIDPEG
jgi:PAS domain S-box-containing protein